jgi:hypothetical protein
MATAFLPAAAHMVVDQAVRLRESNALLHAEVETLKRYVHELCDVIAHLNSIIDDYRTMEQVSVTVEAISPD